MSIVSNDLKADWQLNHAIYTDAYQSGRSSFIHNLLPTQALQFSVYQTLDLLHKRMGNETLRKALDPTETIPSPVSGQPDGEWMKRSNMVGINVRTIGSFWQVVNYVLTIPECHDSIHLLPIWEPGVVGSLYGMVSWQINPEFFDVDLARYVPVLNTVEKQLKVVMNLLHAMGRTVGMDVIPHTDRFSEMVLACPSLFEWVRRDEDTIADHSSMVYKYAEEAIWQHLKYVGAADGTPLTFAKDLFFSTDLSVLTNDKRLSILFGYPNDYGGRLQRRINLIRYLTSQGLETVPMTMGPPYRGLHIDPDDFVIDEYGQTWYQYAFDEPQAMSRVFGPLARYRFYESKDNNQHWELDFDRPNYHAWAYLSQKVHECQQAYNFDFMRGDMAHVQMRPDGVPDMVGHYYDPLRSIKRYVRSNGVPHFAFFAETFLAPPDVMGYGDELDHLEAIEAETTLGDLQSVPVYSIDFRKRFTDYYSYLKTRRFAPSFTIITADKDDPRFDEFYQTGNLFRYFVSLFLTDMPSYVSLGFELRNQHLERGDNEEYSKLYVFRIEDDRQPDKVTHGPYVWGQNTEQFIGMLRMRVFAERIWSVVVGKETRWIVAPDDIRFGGKFIAWAHTEPTGYVFAASLSGTLPDVIPGAEEATTDNLLFDESGCRIWQVL